MYPECLRSRMLGVGAVVAAACFAACGTKPEPPKAAEAKAPTPAANHFTGTVKQLGEGDDLDAFLSGRDHQTVTLDVLFPADSFEGGQTSDSEFFVLFEECEGLPEGQKPAVGRCSGTEYNISKAAGAGPVFSAEGSGKRLRGRFRVESAGGPNQGLMSVRLVPVSQ